MTIAAASLSCDTRRSSGYISAPPAAERQKRVSHSGCSRAGVLLLVLALPLNFILEIELGKVTYSVL
jgi:hypothetical protein